MISHKKQIEVAGMRDWSVLKCAVEDALLPILQLPDDHFIDPHQSLPELQSALQNVCLGFCEFVDQQQ